MKKFNEFLNEQKVNTIYLRDEIKPENSEYFWESGKNWSVNLGNLINSIKRSYGYVVDNIDNRDENMSDVVVGMDFLKDNYPILDKMLEEQGSESTITVAKTKIPNQYIIF